jgi:site-specific recombinase XerD
LEPLLTSRKRRGLPDDILTADEVEALLSVCSHQSSTGIRNRALITALYRGGLRLGEALALASRDIDPRSGILLVTNPTTGRARRIRIDPLSFGLLERWLDRRRLLGLNGRAPFFCTLAGDAIKQAYVRALLPRLARQAGIEKRCHAHALRHTHAAELVRRRTSVEEIQLQLGLASRASTVRYIAGVGPGVRGERWVLQRWVG